MGKFNMLVKHRVLMVFCTISIFYLHSGNCLQHRKFNSFLSSGIGSNSAHVPVSAFVKPGMDTSSVFQQQTLSDVRHGTSSPLVKSFQIPSFPKLIEVAGNDVPTSPKLKSALKAMKQKFYIDTVPVCKSPGRSRSKLRLHGQSRQGSLMPSFGRDSVEDVEDDMDEDISDDDDLDQGVECDSEQLDGEDYDPMAPRGPIESNNYGDLWLPVQTRPRRNRKCAAIRKMIQESVVRPSNLIYPLFIHDEDFDEEIKTLPGQRRLSIDGLIREVASAKQLGIKAFMIFPKIADDLKSNLAEESYNPDGLVPQAILALKDAHPDALVLADVALDPYSDKGQDGVVDESTGEVLNDITVNQICKQALTVARAGADMVCPSEMMDGRVTAIRESLDMEGCVNTSILSYTCKYASSLYGPFRDALDSHVRGSHDKKTYQMDFSNAREAEREAELDAQEGADMIMVKPGLPYLDILQRIRRKTTLPLAAYHVSGEYAMAKAAAEKGWIDERNYVLEALKSFRRAGADAIATYYAKEAAQWMHDGMKSEGKFSEPCY